MAPLRSLWLLVLCATLAWPAGAERPNFLIILADDLGYNDVGFTGPTAIQTPHIDAIAAAGVTFTNGYVTHPYCGPSRAALVTGRYQARFGMEVNLTNSPFDVHSGLPVKEKTFATRLKAVGYRTAIVGKWHLGGSPPFHPNSRGFDYFYGFLAGGHRYWPDSVDSRHPLLLPDGRPHYSANEGCLAPLARNGEAAEFDEYLTTALSRDAAAWAAKGEEPFCLYLAYNAPHQPLEAPRELVEKYRHLKGRDRQVYAAMVDAMDQGIGMVVDALRDAGKLDNTLVFFLSDNGGIVPGVGAATSVTGAEPFADNTPFRAGKSSLLEGGTHVPFVASWPAGWPSGAVYEQPVSAIDIAATVVALGRGDATGQPMDGVDLSPYVTGQREGPPHDALFWRLDNGVGWCVRTPAAKFVLDPVSGLKNGPKLFDMVADPYESTNLATQSPAIRQELAALWNAWNAGNEPNKYLQANEYQRTRLQFYEDLRKRLDARAAKREPLVIE
ncbi:MAG: sulfatase-like hydrolase/transferase [Planctomycetota bacterium]